MGQPAQQAAVTPAYELDLVADRMAERYERMVAFNRRQGGMTQEEAETHVRATTDWDVERVTGAPVDQLSWYALQSVMERDPALALAGWERIKQTACEELTGGHRAAAVFDFDGEPWDRAQFLAIRASFREQWQPQGGVEDALIDGMAQMYSGYLYWFGQLHVSATTEGKVAVHDLKENGHWVPPRVEVAEWIEQAGTMVERFNRLFLRTLRALRDLRRYAPTVIVQNAGQVNVGAVQKNEASVAMSTVESQPASNPSVGISHALPARSLERIDELL
jgi:hypothetical protein